MRSLRYFALALPALFVAATCVTSTTQRGPGGPWVAEVTNTGDEPVQGVAVRADIVDASGRDFGVATAFTCPTTIPPHSTVAAEVFFPSYIQPPPVLPLRATFEPVPLTGQGVAPPAFGLDVAVTETHRDQRFVMASVTNNSGTAWADAQVCATLRSPSGTLLEVGNTPLFPSVLLPGETQTVPVFFNTMPEGTVTLFASGLPGDCCTTVFDPSLLTIDSTAITGSGSGRVLHAAGSLRNLTGQDFYSVRALAYIEGAPQTRVEGSAGCSRGGYTSIARGETAPLTFDLPVPAGISAPKIRIVGAEGRVAAALASLKVSEVDVRPFGKTADGREIVAVAAMVTNQTSSWVAALPCATLRDVQGNVVGQAPLVSRGGAPSYMAPGTSARFDGVGIALKPATSVDVAASGAPGGPPVFSPAAGSPN